ncbi:MAG: hypothetical protein PUD90_04935 [Clostridia bacterium]|nr:hypothetical protein [[Bacteroides] pectinophilus]MDD5872785.1 hypothetical protein [Clostridia bacterium]
MKRKMLSAMACACAMIIMTGCGVAKGNGSEGDNVENNVSTAQVTASMVAQTTAGVQGSTVNAVSKQQTTEASSELVMYVTTAERSLKVLGGYTMDNGSKKEVTKQPLADGCTFYNNNGEQIAYKDFADAVEAQASGAGVECKVQYEGKQIIKVSILDKAVNTGASGEIPSTLYQHMGK